MPTVLSCGQHCSALSTFFFKTQTLLATLRTQHLLLGESYVSSEAEHLSPSGGGVRNKHQYPTVLQSLKSFRWMLDCAWMVCLLSTFGTLFAVLRSTINTARQNKLAPFRQQTESKHQLKRESERMSNCLFCGFRSYQHAFSSG